MNVHSRGPWRLDGNGWAIDDSTGLQVAHVIRNPIGDAPLIVAAPDMLDLLRAFSTCTCSGHVHVARAASALLARIDGITTAPPTTGDTKP